MRSTLAIARRELDGYFATPLGWLCLCGYVALAGVFFVIHVFEYSNQSVQAAMNPYMAGQININDYLITPYFGNNWVILLLICPMLSMRLFAEDRSQRSLELLLSSPISSWQIVVGKYLGAMGFVTVLLASTLPHVGFLYLFGQPDTGIVTSMLATNLILAGAFMAVGMCTSAFTVNQIVAALFSFGMLLTLWVLMWVESVATGGFGTVLGYVSLLGHLEQLAKGLLHLQDAVYFLTFIGFFLFATQQRVEAFRWQ